MVIVLVIALLLDAAFGEPRWLWQRLPHPTVLMGWVIGWCDEKYNHGDAQQAKGAIVVVCLVLGAGLIGVLLSLFGPIAEILVLAILLAHRSLVDHVRAVASGLRVSLPTGRQAVAKIVSRDTGEMPQDAVARSAIESAAENLSDGVVAPVFWFMLAGLPGLLIYKVVNTADSMIGYRTPRHEAFGWAAARLDDLLNLIPARLTALLIALSHGQVSAWRAITQDARKHRSPNAGWPEAAMARALDVALSGPRSYGGEMRDFPYVNGSGRIDIGADEIDDTCAALWRTWATALGAILVVAVVTG